MSQGAKKQMHGTESPFYECPGAAGNRDQPDSLHAVHGRCNSTAQPLRQRRPELALAVALEGKKRLGQFFPVHARGHHRENGSAVDVHQCRGLRLSPEGSACQYPDLAFACHAERQVLGTAADTVHRQGQRQQLNRGPADLVSGPQEPPFMLSPVLRRSLRDRQEVRIRRWHGPAGSLKELSTSHIPILAARRALEKPPGVLCGQQLPTRQQQLT